MTAILAMICAGVAAWMWIPQPRMPRATQRPSRTWPVSATDTQIALLIGLVAWAISGWFVAGLAATIATGAVRLYLAKAPARRRAARAAEQLPSTLILLAATLEAGLPMRGAIASVADLVEVPTAEVLGDVERQISLGMSERQAWMSLDDDPVWGAVAKELARASESGTAVVETLRIHAEEAERHANALAENRARAIGVHSVMPLVFCFLPAFLLVGIVPVLGATFASLFGR